MGKLIEAVATGYNGVAAGEGGGSGGDDDGGGGGEGDGDSGSGGNGTANGNGSSNCIGSFDRGGERSLAALLDALVAIRCAALRGATAEAAAALDEFKATCGVGASAAAAAAAPAGPLLAARQLLPDAVQAVSSIGQAPPVPDQEEKRGERRGGRGDERRGEERRGEERKRGEERRKRRGEELVARRSARRLARTSPPHHHRLVDVPWTCPVMTRPRLVGQALAPDLAADSALSGRAKLTAVLAVDDFCFGALYTSSTLPRHFPDMPRLGRRLLLWRAVLGAHPRRKRRQ